MATKNKKTQGATRSVRVAHKILSQKWSFSVAFFLIFGLTVMFAAGLDILPDTSKTEAQTPVSTPVIVDSSATTSPELPTKVEIPAISLKTTVSNPQTTDIEILDKALLSGAVRYPSSSNLGETGNVIIFGHSSYLPIVHNQAFKTFDGIQNLKHGDLITVTGSDHVYTYAVTDVRKASATSDAIPLTTEGETLTLATCNSFGSKSDRFVVTAVLVESHPVSR